jgi:hypothetical protein
VIGFFLFTRIQRHLQALGITMNVGDKKYFHGRSRLLTATISSPSICGSVKTMA